MSLVRRSISADDIVTETRGAAPPPRQDTAGRIGRSAILLSALSGLGLLLMLVWQLSIAALFGTSTELDAFWIALALPKAVVESVHLGILTLLFVLVYNLGAEMTAEDRSRLASSLFNVVLFSTAILIPALFFGAPPLVRWMGPGLPPEAHALSARLLPILSLVLVPTAVTGLMAGVLHSHQRFLPFALSRVAGLSLQIGVLFVLALRSGVDALVWATLAGAVVTLVLCTPSFLRTGFRYSPVLQFRGNEARAVVGLFAALAAFAILERLGQVSSRFFASTLAPGSVSALEFGWRFEIPVSQLLSLSVALPSFAIMAVQAAEKRLLELRETVVASLRLVALMVIPLASFLVVLRHPIVSLWFERGSFSAESSSLVASLIPTLAVIFLMRGFGFIMLFGLLSTRRHRPLIAILFLEVVFSTILNALLVGPLGLRGIVLATAIAMVGAHVWLWTLFLRTLEGWSFSSLVEEVWKPFAVSLTSSLILLMAYQLMLSGRLADTKYALAVQLAVVGFLFVILHFFLGRISGVINARLVGGIPRLSLVPVEAAGSDGKTHHARPASAQDFSRRV